MSEPAMMDKMESALAAALEDHLISLGFFVTRQFVVPNAHGRLIDLYIAAPLRAFIEIKLREPKAAIWINGLYAQMRDITRIFGGECVPILVTRSNEWIQNENQAELSRNIPRAGGKIGITRTFRLPH
jgi:hypothetical protein